MKAIAIERTGGPDVLTVHDLPVPELKADEALVKLEASGVNFIDTYQRSGHYKLPHFPFVLGSEGAGTVESIGDGVENVAVGDRVAYAMVPGAYAEYAAVPASRLVKIPDGVSSRDAAALMLQGMTAHYLVNSTFPAREGTDRARTCGCRRRRPPAHAAGESEGRDRHHDGLDRREGGTLQEGRRRSYDRLTRSSTSPQKLVA